MAKGAIEPDVSESPYMSYQQTGIERYDPVLVQDGKWTTLFRIQKAKGNVVILDAEGEKHIMYSELPMIHIEMLYFVVLRGF